MHTALPQHGREIKGLCLFSVNVCPYSVKNPHIDSFILPSMHYMPTCFQQKWYICEWSWPCERKSVQNVENQASVTQGKKERQLWRQKHSTVQGQSQPIECRFFFVLCSFTLSACLSSALCLLASLVLRHFGWMGKLQRRGLGYVCLILIWWPFIQNFYNRIWVRVWFSVVQPNALWVSLERAPAWEKLRSLMQKGARRSGDQWSRGEYSCKRAVITSNQSWLPSSGVTYRVEVVYYM